MLIEAPRNLTADSENLAAELTEAAFPVALRRGLGTDWLDRKLELWNALTRTVHAWEGHAWEGSAQQSL